MFPTDTVYGVCCDPADEAAARRLYELKGRPSKRPAAVMFFSLEAALAELGELADSERGALQALLPGPVTLLLENRSGLFRAACRSDPSTLGLRVPHLPNGLQALGSLDAPVMQTSANLSGQPDARTLAHVPRRFARRRRSGVGRWRAAGDAVDGRRPARLRAERQLVRPARGRARGRGRARAPARRALSSPARAPASLVTAAATGA